MTRRKRSPPPSSSNSLDPTLAWLGGVGGGGGNAQPSSSFQIPLSLQRLSQQTSSLARAADLPREVQNSNLVARAQALSASPGLSAGLAVQHGQQEQQLYTMQVPHGVGGVAPSSGGGGGSNGGGGPTIAAPQGALRGGHPPSHGPGNGLVGKGRTNKELKWRPVGREFPDEQTWVRPKSTPALVARHRGVRRRWEALFPEGQVVNGGATYAAAAAAAAATGQEMSSGMGGGLVPGLVGAVQGHASNIPDEGGGGRKRRKVEFRGTHQRAFPEAQTWVQPVVRQLNNISGKVLQNDDPEKAVQDNTPVYMNVEARRQAIIAGLKARSSVDAGGGGGGGERAVKGAGQDQQPSPGTRPPLTTTTATNNNNNKSTTKGAENSTLEYSKHQQEIAALIEKKRRENAASGQMQRLLGLRQAHLQNSVGVGVGAGGSPAVSSGGGVGRTVSLPAGGVRATLGEGTVQQGQGMATPVLPSVELQDANANANATDEEGVDGDGGGDGDDAQDSDEDAPGEDDTPEQQQQQLQPQRPSQQDGDGNLNTDAGDLRSLFSSAGTSPPPQIQQQDQQQQHQPNQHLARNSFRQQRGMSGYEQQQQQGYTGQYEQEGPESPSAQLLMALANASTGVHAQARRGQGRGGVGGNGGGGRVLRR